MRVCHAVVVYCHSEFPVMARFLFRAQDQNMTNGDFAYFTWGPQRRGAPRQPWMKDVQDPNDIPRRRQAYHAVKQVRDQHFPAMGLLRSLVLRPDSAYDLVVDL